MTEKDLKKLFEEKLEGQNFEFNEANWEAFEQMSDPGEPMSEQEFKKLFRDKLAQASFPFNPANWDALEEEMGPEHGMSNAELQELFDKKINQSQFAYNPDNWARMEAILDQKGRKPLAFYWRSAAAILAAAGISSLLLFQNQANQFGPTETALPQQNIVETAPAAKSPVAAETVEMPLSQSPETIENSTPALSNSSASTTGNTLESEDLAYVQDNRALVIGAHPTESSPAVQALRIEPNSNLQASDLHPMNVNLDADLAPRHFVMQDLSSEEPVIEPYIPQAYSKVYASGGLVISQALNGKMGSPGFSAGLEYEYGWNKISSVRTGIIYTQSGDIGLETMHDSTFFGLGRTEVQTARHYKSLQSLRIPVSYQYKLNSQHSFGLGLNTDVLLSVRMDETKTTTVFKQDPKVEHKEFNQSMNSFAPVNFSASLSYEFQYSERLSFALSYALPLNDITQDQAQNFAADHRPGQANLQLRYLLFKN
tara:strand:+ start:2548 stop:3996 length:1449 start_codon:yes stop_codon:yes gene_type:complete